MGQLRAEAPKVLARVHAIDRFDVLEQLDRDPYNLQAPR